MGESSTLQEDRLEQHFGPDRLMEDGHISWPPNLQGAMERREMAHSSRSASPARMQTPAVCVQHPILPTQEKRDNFGGCIRYLAPEKTDDDGPDWSKLMFSKRFLGKVDIKESVATGNGIALLEPIAPKGFFEVNIKFNLTDSGPFNSIGMASTNNVNNAHGRKLADGLTHSVLRGWGIRATGEVVQQGKVVGDHRINFSKIIQMKLDAYDQMLHMVQDGNRIKIAYRTEGGTLTPVFFLDDSSVEILSFRHWLRESGPSKREPRPAPWERERLQ